MRPVDFATDGVFLCGLAHYPKHIDETIAQASAVGARVGVLLSKGIVEAEANISVVDETKCKGCGSCAATCPVGAISPLHFTTEQIDAMIDEAATKMEKVSNE